MQSKNIEYISFDDDPNSRVIEQQSQAWFDLKAGQISASRMCQMMAEGNGLTREKYKMKLAVERLTGQPVNEGFKSAAIDRGNELEPQARDFYEVITGCTITQVPFICHDNVGLASPDALVDDDGLLEIKCPQMHTHLHYLITKKIPRAYMLQMYWQLACTKRKWVDWLTFYPELPPNLRAFIVRVPYHAGEIQTLEREAQRFDNEINELVEVLRKL